MEREAIYRRIQCSPKRDEIELALLVLFGQTDIRRIEDRGLSIFVERVLPKLEGGDYEKQ